MVANLLASISTPVWIAIGVVGAFAVASVVYGVFRNFMRMAWTSWQILAIFALTLLLKVIPVPDGWQGFAVSAALLFGATVLVLIAGGAIRRAMLRSKRNARKGYRVFNRILGAITSLLNVIMLLVVLGGFALGVIYYVVPVKGLEDVFAHPVWTEFGNVYVQDLALISVCLFFVRGGYRIGVARSFQTTITLALTLGSLVLAMYLTLTVPFMRGWVSSIGTAIAGWGLNVVIATMVSYFIIVAICFLIFFAVVMLLGFFLNKLTRKYRSVRVLGVIDGVILSVVFFAFFLVLVIGFYFGVDVLVNGNLESLGQAGAIAEGARDTMRKVEQLITSAPLADLWYHHNLIRILFC